MKKVTKETHLQLLLIILLIAAVILMVQNPFNKKAVIPAPQPSPQPYVAKPMSQEAKDLKAKLVKTDKYVGDLTLVDEAKFKVEYLISNEKFLVTVKEAPYVASKKAAEEWFINQGFVDFDLCTLQISFVSAKGVVDNLEARDMVFDRCPVPDREEATGEADLVR